MEDGSQRGCDDMSQKAEGLSAADFFREEETETTHERRIYEEPQSSGDPNRRSGRVRAVMALPCRACVTIRVLWGQLLPHRTTRYENNDDGQ